MLRTLMLPATRTPFNVEIRHGLFNVFSHQLRLPLANKQSAQLGLEPPSPMRPAVLTETYLLMIKIFASYSYPPKKLQNIVRKFTLIYQINRSEMGNDNKKKTFFIFYMSKDIIYAI